MVDSAIQTVQPSAILPFDFDFDAEAIVRAATDPEDGDGERYVFINDDFVPYSAYRSRFQSAWEQSLSGLQIDESIKSQAYSVSAAAYAATQYRCLTISQVPGLIASQTNKDPLEWHPLIGFMPYLNRLMWQIEISQLVWGVCYLKKVYNKYKYPSSLQWAHPQDINPQADQYNEVYEYYDTLTGETLKRRSMIEIRTFDPDRSLNGKSAYEVAMSRITTERNLVMHAGSFFFNSARPDGILVSKTRLNKDERDKAKKDWEKFRGSKNAWQTFISGGDWDWLPITIPPVDLAMHELREDTHQDICAIFRTNGALIGLASVSDPLSAGSTLQTVKRSHIESVTLPDYNDIAFNLNEQWLWCDFEDKNYYTLVADEANMPILSDVTAEVSTVAVNLTNPLNPVVDYNEARKLMKMPPREGYIGRAPDQSLAMANGSLISLNEGRQFLQLDPYEIDILKTPDGKLIRRTDLGKYLDATIELIVNPPQPLPGIGGGFGGLQLPPFTPTQGGMPATSAPTPLNPYDQFRLPLASNTRSGSGCAVTLCFSNDEIVRSIQTIMRTQTADSISQVWCDPGEFHLTIFQCDVISMAQEVDLYSALAVTKPMPLTVKRVTKFDQDKCTVLILEVEPSDDLKSLQAKIYEKAGKLGVASASDYSDPASWKPHITLAYLDPEMDVQEVVFNAQVQPQAIRLTRTDYIPHYTKEIPAEPKERLQPTKRSTVSIEVAADFGGNNFLKTAQRVLSRWTTEEGMLEVEWYDVDTFRMPMVELDNISSYDTARAMELVSSSGMPRADTYTGMYVIRAGEIGVTLIPSDEIYNIRNTASLQMDELRSEDEQPLEGWTPFIPMGIVRNDALADRELFESAGYPMVLSAICLLSGSIRRGKWEIRNKPQYDKELTTWQRVVIRKGRDYQFVPDSVKGLVADYIDSALRDTLLPIEDVFTRAREIVQTGLTYTEPDVDPTPEEYQEYWRGYDDSKIDIGQEWKSYMGRALPEVLRWMETETTPAGIQEVLNKHHDQLAADWVGTDENPGSLYSVVLAGMVAGNDALVKGVSMNPTKRAKPNIGIEITWDLLSQQARDYARQYSYELIKGIDDTTARMAQGIFEQWTKSGQPFSVLSDALTPVFNDKARADDIAQTEGIRVYNRGAFKRWTDVGVKRARWRTVQDGLVCRVCRPLNGQVADISAGWVHPGGDKADSYRGKVYGDSAHTKCRCFRTPDTSNLMEERPADQPAQAIAKPVKPVSEREFKPMTLEQIESLNHDWHEKFKAIDAKTKKTVEDYAHLGFNNTNAYLRGTRMYDPDSGEDLVVNDAVRADQDAKIAAIESVMQPLDRDTIAYRGLRDIEILGIDPNNLEAAVGSQFSDSGFTSTSLNPSIAKGFGQFNGGVVLKIRVPEGTQSAFISPVASQTMQNESELLLGKGQEYRIISVSPKKEKSWMTTYEVEVEVVGTNSAKPVPKPKPVDVRVYSPVPNTEYEQMSREWTSKINSTLPDKTITDIRNYTGSSYGSINMAMRDSDKYDKYYHDIPKEHALKVADNISTAMSPIGKDIQVYRGVNADAFGLEIDKHYAPLPGQVESLIGTEFVDKAFVSTSIDPETLSVYGNIKMTIDIPAGTKAVYVAGVSQVGSERELLLDRNQKFRIVSVEPYQDSAGRTKYNVHVELVQ